MGGDTLLSMKQIEISFPGVKALDRVDFDLMYGEIHALLGENGAGKSTLIKCLTGVNQMDAGEICLEGRRIRPTTPQHAMDMGISTVFQEINLCPNLTVAENIFIGRQPMRRHQINWREINRRAEELLARFDVRIDVARPLSSYSTAIQQMVSLARAVDVKARVLILDEPTSSLDDNEVRRLFKVMRELRGQGLGIIFITHFLDQVFEITDRITVLRNGRLVGSYETASTSKFDLVSNMIGKDINEIFNLKRARPGADAPVSLEADGISIPGKSQRISFTAKRGELLGFAGLLGAGRTETAEMLFGISKPSRGTVKLKGEPVRLRSPMDAIRRRIAFCPEDRKRDGIIGDLTIRENIALAVQAKRGMLKPFSRREMDALADQYISLLAIATPDAEKRVSDLSGGNQQKVILARWMATRPDVLILDEPTRGIDVGAKAEVQRLMLSMCADEVTVLFISSELDEIIRCSSKILVMRDGAKAGELNGDDATQSKIMAIIAGEAQAS